MEAVVGAIKHRHAPDTAPDGVTEVAVLLARRVEQRHLLLLLGVHREPRVVQVWHRDGLHQQACVLLLVLAACGDEQSETHEPAYNAAEGTAENTIHVSAYVHSTGSRGVAMHAVGAGDGRHVCDTAVCDRARLRGAAATRTSKRHKPTRGPTTCRCSQP